MDLRKYSILQWKISGLRILTPLPMKNPHNFFIEALEDSEVLLIPKKDKEFAYSNLPKTEKLFRAITKKNMFHFKGGG